MQATTEIVRFRQQPVSFALLSGLPSSSRVLPIY
jgi:hypothetical protein